MAHQRRGQISDAGVIEALESCAIRFERERHAPTGQFNAYIDGIPQEPLALTVKLVRPSDYPQLSKARQAQQKAELRDRFSVTTKAPPAGYSEPPDVEAEYTGPTQNQQGAWQRPRGPIIDDVEWEDITEEEERPRRRPRKLPPPPASSTDFEL
jgi:hypothetical protein